jgi:hypothetical protein
MRRSVLSTVVAVLLPAALAAQQAPAASGNPTVDAAKMIGGRAAKNLMAAADQVPADKLGYKPTDAQMTYGQIWAHLVEANYGICGAIGGAKPPAMAELKGTESKEALVAALKGSFAFCDDAIAKAQTLPIGDQVDLGFMKGTRAFALIVYVADLADHYSQIANYMRLNGMLPPSAQPKK